MIKFIEMDENVTLSDQMEEYVDPVILINKFNVKSEDIDQLMKAWEPMLHILSNSQVSFLHNFTAVLVVVVYLSTMQFGSQRSFLKMRLISLSLNPNW